MLKEGDKAPAVVGTSYDGRTFNLGAPGRPTVLFFYPKAATGGCTTEAKEFNALYDEFEALGVQVVGASVDKPEANERWAKKLGLRMPLISDTGEHPVASAFGVARPMVGVAKRTTWLIDADGTLRRVWPKVTPAGHAAEVLAAVREVWGAGA
jgi:peroxiredoxin Q/BCP